MAFDGLFINGLVKQLQQELTGGRIDKVHQPENDEVQIAIRSNNTNHKLKISVDPSIPYLTLLDDKKENPLQPPLFCMLLRKHLTSGKVIAIRQMGLERVIEMDVESRDELGNQSVKTLAIEIMGKHSNIVLYQKEDQRILESIKRISAVVSRVRQIYPGIPYTPPPFDKLNLLELNEADLPEPSGEMTLAKWLVQTFQGFSPVSARLLVFQADLPEDCKVSSLSPAEHRQTRQALMQLKQQLTGNQFQYGVVLDGFSKDKPVDLYAFSPRVLPEGHRLETYGSAVDTLNAFYAKRDQGNRMDQKASHIKKSVQTRLEKAYLKLDKLNEDLATAEHADEHKIKGELILANLYQLEKGQSKASLLNYYTDPPETIDIPLDLRLTPVDNAQRYFKKYAKAKNGQIEILKQLEDTEAEIQYLENVLIMIEQTTDVDNLEAIRNELAAEGYVKRKSIGKPKKNTAQPLAYRSSEGFEILVGKNNLQNDLLTLKIASNKDLWLHTKVIPGSHVIIRTQGQEVPEQTLLEAATIAAWHSKGRASGQVPVDYTPVKNVTKPAGAKPGMVIYSTNKTLYVTPDEDFVKALLHPSSAK